MCVYERYDARPLPLSSMTTKFDDVHLEELSLLFNRRIIAEKVLKKFYNFSKIPDIVVYCPMDSFHALCINGVYTAITQRKKLSSLLNSWPFSPDHLIVFLPFYLALSTSIFLLVVFRRTSEHRTFLALITKQEHCSSWSSPMV